MLIGQFVMDLDREANTVSFCKVQCLPPVYFMSTKCLLNVYLMSAGHGHHNPIAMGLDLRQASLGPDEEPLFSGDPHNVPRRQGLNRMSSMQQQVCNANFQLTIFES